ncbi:MAG: response regulator transcription factor [Proteobacteria bacterium]|uniref:response regulator n=1 Tax=Thauera sp. 2A1 TaxID=2570191 RepID=UPI0012924269|nr:response regulator transcription factor [Thauera sp. 2A1]KAI5916076.1 response regulator transcription factor [Thauera sp. 2A1]MBS0510576.1 response regulator transcription factor [Pseudomonadota bacterium]MBS0551089.1 response regulator transcription factor [Pseudomonadota bacterium]
MMVRLILADDHQMFRHALRALLEKDKRMTVVAEASSGDELLDIVRQVQADVVCIDIGMPGMNGIEATRRLLAIQPGIKVIGLSAFSDRQFVMDMLNAGATGYVTKAEAGDELIRAIQTVRRGRSYLCPDVAATVTSALMENMQMATAAPRISARERQVLQLIAEGHTSVRIAERLHVAASTVEVHRRNIMRKLDLHSVADLTRYAIRNGITSVSN